jgi:hypothetical protein
VKIEVFIPYSIKESSIVELGKTLDAWDTDEYDPIAIQVKDLQNENMIRVAAEAIAKSDYIISWIGSDPQSPRQLTPKGSIRVEPCQPRIQ